ncbi:hypothetical protein B0H13DRAFT_1982726 [Mycena leptocephala]|nr:hypothetical protein B0H13DRAFT_1982726 [Mycena leptocephala]
MPRRSAVDAAIASRQPSAEELIQEIENLDDFHQKIISRNQLAAHDRVWRIYEGFTDAYYAALAQVTQPARLPPPPRVAVPGTPPPCLKHIEGFILHMSRNVRGMLGDWPCKDTIHNYLIDFFALWNRRTGVSIPVEDKKQAVVYLSSKPFRDRCPLVTAAQPKPIASFVDVKVITDAIWLDQPGMRLARERLQAVYGLLLLAFTSSRPGEVVVSSVHAGSGQALYWSDHEFILLPNPDNPLEPLVFLHVLFRLLKTFRDNDSKFRSCVFRLDKDNLSICPVFAGLLLGCKDQVFPDYATPRKLRMDPERAKLAVLRQVVHVDGEWKTSDQPLPYQGFKHVADTYLSKRVSRVCDVLGFYAVRRGVGNLADGVVSEAQRKLIMAHSQLSTMFASAYQSKTITTDLQGMVQGTAEDRTGIEFVLSMTGTRDAEAPRSATPEIIATVEAVPVVADLNRQIEEVVAQIQELELTDMDTAASEQTLADLRKAYRNAYTTELRWAVQEARESYFEDKKRRQAVGETTSRTKFDHGTHKIDLVPIATTGPSFHGQSPLVFAIPDPWRDFHALLFSDANTSRPGHFFVPGEGLIHNKCCACQGDHPQYTLVRDVHVCVGHSQQKAANNARDVAFVQRLCSWFNCSMAFQNADELWSHVKTTHLRQTKTISCLWDGCSAEHPASRMPRSTFDSEAEVRFCTLCSQWSWNFGRDQQYADCHAEAHFRQLFAGFQIRADYEELSPSQVQISNGVAVFSKSEPTGPDRPQFHQVYCRDVPVLPGFCPWCVFDDSLDIQHRMKQHLHRDHMRVHLWDHLHSEADQALCPSPACGRKLYSHDELQMHMVLQHRLPLFGSAGGSAHYTKLRLSSASSTVTSSIPTPDNTIPTPITLTATSSSSKRPLTDASDSGSNSAKRGRLKPLQPPVFTPTIIPAGLFSRVDALASANNSSARVNKKSQDDLGGEGFIFSGSIKALKAPQLKDLARSLELEETGTREVLIDRILKHFNLPENQSLKEDKRFVDLWNRRRRRVAGPKQTEDVLTDSQKVASRAGSSIQRDFDMLPPPNPSYQFPDMWIPPEPHVHYQHPIDNPPPFSPAYPRDRPPSTNTRTPPRDTFTTLHNDRNLSLRSLTP